MVVKQNMVIIQKGINLSKYDKAFVTGCDKSNEWMLDWFLENYKKHNDTPIIFADFGISKTKLKDLTDNKKFHAIMHFKKEKNFTSWFLKPTAMIHAPSTEVVWIDTDCEVLGDLSGISDDLEPRKLNMVQDRPWTKRNGSRGPWYNSGIVGVIDRPLILKQWETACTNNPTQRGDQEVLYFMLDEIAKITHINELHNKYNVIRLQYVDGTVPKEVLVKHHTGFKGKDKIKELMEK